MFDKLFNRKRRTDKNRLEQMIPFKGVGTVFISDLIGFENISENISPERLVELLHKYLTLQHEIIEDHKGIVIQYEGDTVFAFWHPENKQPNHAQLAFDASKKIILAIKENIHNYSDRPLSISISLGTDIIAGDFFSSLKRFQIVGPAYNIAETLLKYRDTGNPCILFSSNTIKLLDINTSLLSKVDQIQKKNGKIIEVFAYTENNDG